MKCCAFEFQFKVKIIFFYLKQIIEGSKINYFEEKKFSIEHALEYVPRKY